MKKMSSAVRDRHRMLGALGLLALLAANGLAAEGPSWRIDRGDVKILVPLKPGGAFAATEPCLSGTLALEGSKPARLAGEVSMDLATIDTGISLRNQHLRENYLDLAKGEGFSRAVLSDIHLSDVGGDAFDGTTPFTGTLLLHGVKHPVAGTVEIHREGEGRRVRAKFPLVLTDFAVTPPEYLGVGVGSSLLAKVSPTARRVPPPAR